MYPDPRQTKILVLGSIGGSLYDYSHDLPAFLTVYTRLLYAGINIPPPGLLFDLYAVLRRYPRLVYKRRKLSGSEFYEDHFLDVFQSSPELKMLHEISAVFADDLFNRFFERFVHLFFRHFSHKNTLEFNPAFVKELIEGTSDMEVSDCFNEINQNRELFFWLDYRHWTMEFRRLDPVLNSGDFRELREINNIDSESLRFALRECIREREILREKGKAFLSRYKRYFAVLPESAPVKKEAGDYPVGGVSEISTRGNPENILNSELLYMEEGEELDLFDVRYVERELLYFMRDMNQIEEFRETVRIRLYSCDEYPMASGSGIYPFFLFAILAFWLEFASQLNKSVHFEFQIEVEEKNRRDTDMLRVLKSFLRPWTETGKAVILPLSLENSVKGGRQKKRRELCFGRKIVARNSFFWKGRELFFKDEQDKTFGFREKGEQNSLKWLNLGFCVFFNQPPLRYAQEV